MHRFEIRPMLLVIVNARIDFCRLAFFLLKRLLGASHSSSSSSGVSLCFFASGPVCIDRPSRGQETKSRRNCWWRCHTQNKCDSRLISHDCTEILYHSRDTETSNYLIVVLHGRFFSSSPPPKLIIHSILFTLLQLTCSQQKD